MNQKPIYMFAKWQVKEGELVNVLHLLAEVVEKSRAETGNLFYKIHQSNSDKNALLLYEGYADEMAVDAHRNSEHFKSLVVGQIVPGLANREVILASELIFP